MWDWLVDEPSWAYWLPAGGGVVFLLVAVRTQRAVYLLGVVAMAAVMGLVALADYLVVTDRERVVGIVLEMVEAGRKQDAEGILQHVADDFRSGPIDRAVLEQELRRHLPHVVSIRRGKLVVERDTESPGFVAHLNISFSGSYEGQLGESAWLLIDMRFRRDSQGVWKMTSAEVYDALGKNRYWPR
jgi:hypothetical protein